MRFIGHGLKNNIIQGTVVVDVRITASSFSPKSRCEKLELRVEESDHEQQEEASFHADHQAHWLNKRKKTYDAYQWHMITTKEDLMLRRYTRYPPISRSSGITALDGRSFGCRTKTIFGR